MEYSEGRAGRVCILKVNHGEDLRAAIIALARERKISHAMVQVLGAVGDARIVTGPEEPVLPPVPHWETVTGGWEMIGIGTIHPGQEGPILHLHAAFGSGTDTRAGCIRESPVVYLVAEAVITEIVGISCPVLPDETTGVSLPFPGRGPR